MTAKDPSAAAKRRLGISSTCAAAMRWKQSSITGIASPGETSELTSSSDSQSGTEGSLESGRRGAPATLAPSRAPVAQGIERCPAEAEVARSNRAGRMAPRLNAEDSGGFSERPG